MFRSSWFQSSPDFSWQGFSSRSCRVGADYLRCAGLGAAGRRYPSAAQAGSTQSDFRPSDPTLSAPIRRTTTPRIPIRTH